MMKLGFETKVFKFTYKFTLQIDLFYVFYPSNEKNIFIRTQKNSNQTLMNS